jgi:energy-coupling factor transporter ATP-binding protein EcfA2
MNDILSGQYGLTFHPFSSDIPVEALTTGKQLDSFLFRVMQQLRDGGFIAITGEPGTGKSAALRIVASRLQAIADIKVGIVSRPQSNNADFYRELGHLFGVTLSPHNRWAGKQGAARTVARSHRQNPHPPGRHHRRSTGNEACRPRRAALALQPQSRRACATHRGHRR